MSEVTLEEREQARRSNRWRELRRKAGVSQPKWAKELGVSERTVSRWENGGNPPQMARNFMLFLSKRRRVWIRRKQLHEEQKGVGSE